MRTLEVVMMNESIKIKKGLKNSIIGGLLFGSSIAAITQVQANPRFLSPAERKKQEDHKKKQQADEATAKRSGLTKKEWDSMPLEKQKEFIEANEKQREKDKRLQKYYKRINYLSGRN
jgi:aspartate oxidase